MTFRTFQIYSITKQFYLQRQFIHVIIYKGTIFSKKDKNLFKTLSLAKMGIMTKKTYCSSMELVNKHYCNPKIVNAQFHGSQNAALIFVDKMKWKYLKNGERG